MNALGRFVASASSTATACSQDYCRNRRDVVTVEIAGELRALCQSCRKDLWGVSS